MVRRSFTLKIKVFESRDPDLLGDKVELFINTGTVGKVIDVKFTTVLMNMASGKYGERHFAYIMYEAKVNE